MAVGRAAACLGGTRARKEKGRKRSGEGGLGKREAVKPSGTGR